MTQMTEKHTKTHKCTTFPHLFFANANGTGLMAWQGEGYGFLVAGCRFDDAQRPRDVGQKSGGENPDCPMGGGKIYRGWTDGNDGTNGTYGTLGRNSSESCSIRPDQTESDLRKPCQKANEFAKTGRLRRVKVS